MGGAASTNINAPASNARLRKALILRAYNIRGREETLEDQFLKYTYKNKVLFIISIRVPL